MAEPAVIAFPTRRDEDGGVWEPWWRARRVARLLRRDAADGPAWAAGGACRRGGSVARVATRLGLRAMARGAGAAA